MIDVSVYATAIVLYLTLIGAMAHALLRLRGIRSTLKREREAVRVLAMHLRANPDLDLAPTRALLDELHRRSGRDSRIAIVAAACLGGQPPSMNYRVLTVNVPDAGVFLAEVAEVISRSGEST